MKAGTKLDPFPASYPGDPLSAVRAEPPKNGEPVDEGEGDEESEDEDTSDSDLGDDEAA